MGCSENIVEVECLECTMWSGVWTVQNGVLSVECSIWSVKNGFRIVQCGV